VLSLKIRQKARAGMGEQDADRTWFDQTAYAAAIAGFARKRLLGRVRAQKYPVTLHRRQIFRVESRDCLKFGAYFLALVRYNVCSIYERKPP
jgi:hypothetical protein